MTQLELFEWLPPARILAFPPHRMTSMVRWAAGKVLAANSPRRELDRLESIRLLRLAQLGITAEERNSLCARYRTEILCEVLRQRRGQMHRGGHGAA